jgi:hypothetical protein
MLAPVCTVAQQPAPPAPIPTPILSAQKVFIANGGMDAVSLQSFRRLGLSDNEPYNSFYDAMKDWGHYRLVDSPADADLVLTLRFTAPQLQISFDILDAKTHFLLWTITQPVQPAALKNTWRKNITAANASLVTSFRKLTTPTAP